MSHYYTRWCDTHGEWDQDIDRPGDKCPDCTAAGTAPSQLQAKELEALRTDYALLSDDYKQLVLDNESLRSRLAEADANAPWLTQAHMICTDHGIPHGNISDRLEMLVGYLAEAERDAERYRRLRVDPSLVVGPSYVLRRTDELDAAIDAFLAKHKEQQ